MQKGIAMANVDFTLDELETSMRLIVKDELETSMRVIVKDELKDFEPRVQKIVKIEIMEAEGRIKNATKGYIDVLNRELKADILDELAPKLDGIEHDTKSVKRVVNQHSVEILELKARPV